MLHFENDSPGANDPCVYTRRSHSESHSIPGCSVLVTFNASTGCDNCQLQTVVDSLNSINAARRFAHDHVPRLQDAVCAM